jgi:hypothetical protein
MKNLLSLCRTLLLATGMIALWGAPAIASPNPGPQAEMTVANERDGEGVVASEKSPLAAQYEKRSKTDKGVAAFEGGGAGIYIGGSGVAIVLLVVLLIVVL